MTAFKPPSGTSRVYDYVFADGTPAFKVCRRDATGGAKKTFKQFGYENGQWVPKQTVKRGQQPLYMLPALLAAADAPVLLVEGEKAAEGAQQYLPEGWVVTTWAGGSGNIAGPDLTPLAGRRVLIWPDNDEAGRIAAQALVERLGGAHVVTVPVQFPEKWDLADSLPEGITADWVRDKIIHSASNGSYVATDKNLPTNLSGAPANAHAAVQQNPLLLVDSDASQIAAQSYLPSGWACITYDPTNKTSLGPATHAVIWGRNDDGGRAWADTVADAVGIPCHVVKLNNLPEHWHFDAGMPPGRSKQQLTGYLTGILARCALRTPAAAPTALPAPVAATPVPPPSPAANIAFIRNGNRGDGAIKPIMRNAELLIAAYPHVWDLKFNDFSNRACLGNDYLTDADTLRIVSWTQDNGVHASAGTIAEAVMAVAANRRFHPVKTYLDALVWDGIPRLDMLFIDHAGSPDTDLTRAFTSKWFIQAIARIYEPGCQADGTIVLEGIQGLRKSTFFRELFGDMWFTDHLPDIASKDALLQLRGVWCVEIGELATLGRAESAKIKQFLTSRVDRYRDPFGRMVADFPRTCVFSGSINPGAGGYLKDETGARRFWPMPINERIDIGAVSAMRDQLWAEALQRYRAGESWYLDSDNLSKAAEEIVADRFSSDPWQEKIDDFIAARTEVNIADIFKLALNIVDTGKWTQVDMNRISRCLAYSGWVRVRTIQDGQRKWVFVRGPTLAPTTLDLRSHPQQGQQSDMI